MEIDQMGWDLALIIFEGVILAWILSKMESRAAKRERMENMKYVLTQFYALLKAKDSVGIYYFTKLCSDLERKYLKRILLMDLQFNPKNGSKSEVEIMDMRNGRFLFVIDPSGNTYHRLRDLEMENMNESYNFYTPEERVEQLYSFMDYVKKCGKIFGISL
ncbi:hypothetical protein [Candidatus Lokiarchaeum ossiferum]|uniref:hypothetical protein n=1 Tax=Candidatus Lokiarchaeum ossiferum TaxID=2951803 RepID=UPI00352DE0F8